MQQAKEDWSVINLANIYFLFLFWIKAKPIIIYVRWTPVHTCYASTMLFKFSCLLSQPNKKRLRFDSIKSTDIHYIDNITPIS